MRCAPVAATGVGQDLGSGQTTATVSVAGVPIGSTAATFTIIGVVGSTVSFVGPIVLTGLGGTLTADVTGTLDAATGAFTSTSSTVTGAGALSGITGDLTFSDHEDLPTGAFTETISGRLARRHRVTTGEPRHTTRVSGAGTGAGGRPAASPAAP